jgi:hypothetical protein
MNTTEHVETTLRHHLKWSIQGMFEKVGSTSEVSCFEVQIYAYTTRLAICIIRRGFTMSKATRWNTDVRHKCFAGKNIKYNRIQIIYNRIQIECT